MDIKAKMLLHNKFDVTVVDAATGKVKQAAVGYNVITNYYFSSRLTGSPCSRGTDLLSYINIGVGTGTPAITDTGMFTYLTRKTATVIETVYD